MIMMAQPFLFADGFHRSESPRCCDCAKNASPASRTRSEPSLPDTEVYRRRVCFERPTQDDARILEEDVGENIGKRVVHRKQREVDGYMRKRAVATNDEESKEKATLAKREEAQRYQIQKGGDTTQLKRRQPEVKRIMRVECCCPG